MFNCAEDILAHHDEKVTLPDAERNEMRAHRDSNRDRLRKGLNNADKPTPLFFKSQGSYGMRTMIQHPLKDYDIDDGVYFAKQDLVGDRGAEMSALQARQMVRNALDDGSFATPPEVRKNCVRVYYAAGYHVDVPVYRRVTIKNWDNTESYVYELASSSWKRSDARDVTDWFDKENREQSPDTTNGRQLRRVVRQIKKFARSRDSWSGQILSGFGITKLVTECYSPNLLREDKSLHDTMEAIRNRLNWNLVVEHPVTPDSTITTGTDDPKAKFLRDKLSDALRNLEPLFNSDCTSEKARKCWDKVFATDFFSAREPTKAALATPALASSSVWMGQAAAAEGAIRKEGGSRHA